MSNQHFVAHEPERFDELDGLPLATFAQRVLGFAIDLLVVILVWIPIEMLWARNVTHTTDAEAHFHIAFNFHEWRSLLASMLYFVVAHFFSNGLSLGKLVSRTRVVSLVHSRLSLWQCIERVLGYGVATAEGIGFLQYFWSGNRMCVQDRMAETIVVDVRKTSVRIGTSVKS